MPVAESEVLIAAPPEEVWALISGLERGPKWSVVTLECRLTSDRPPGLGCTYRSVSRFVASKISTEHEIVEWVPPRRMVTRAIKGLDSTFVQTCEPQGGGTVLTMRNEFSVPSGLPGLVADRLTRQVTSTLVKELARIKQVVEHRGPSEPSGDGSPVR